MSSPIDMSAIQKPTIISIIMIKTIPFHDNGNAIPAKCPKVNLTPCERIVVRRGRCPGGDVQGSFPDLICPEIFCQE